MEYFRENPRNAYNYKQISATMGITRQISKLMVEDILFELERQHFLKGEENGKFHLIAKIQKERKVMGSDIMTEFE